MNTNTFALWDEASKILKKEVSGANMGTWFKGVFLAKLENGVATIGVPSDFIREWLSGKYQKTLIRVLREAGADARTIDFTVAKEPDRPQSQQSAAAPAAHTPKKPAELPLKNHYINTKTNLNPRYTFDSFIIGSFNELAYSAAQAIIKKPGVYNPLYIYGDTGLGKTHLIQGVGNALAAQFPHMKIYYVSSEKFTHDLVSAIQRGGNAMFKFKEKYRNYDCLIMDDIQFISNRNKTQEELFHLFNILQDHNKQIIFSSDKHPNYIIGLEDRLKSRFSAGMIIDVTRPDFESRLAILKTKLRNTPYPFSNEVIDYIAQNANTSIREMEGILNTLVCQSELKQRALNIDEVQDTIRDSIQARKNIGAQDIARVVAKFYNIDHGLIFEKTRRKEIVKARQMTMYIMREDFHVSFPHIGRELGGRDHTTVIHSCSKIKDALMNQPEVGQEIEQIRSMLETY